MSSKLVAIQLAKNTGVAKGTLYLYFKTREELFLTLKAALLLVSPEWRKVKAAR